MTARKREPPAVAPSHEPVTAETLLEGLPPILTLDEAAAALRCSERQIRKWTLSGELQAIRLTSRIHVTRQSIAELLARALARAHARH